VFKYFSHNTFYRQYTHIKHKNAETRPWNDKINKSPVKSGLNKMAQYHYLWHVKINNTNCNMCTRWLNINWRDVQRMNVLSNVDMSRLLIILYSKCACSGWNKTYMKNIHQLLNNSPFWSCQNNLVELTYYSNDII